MNSGKLTAWELENAWPTIAGHPSLTKQSRPKEADDAKATKESAGK